MYNYISSTCIAQVYQLLQLFQKKIYAGKRISTPTPFRPKYSADKDVFAYFMGQLNGSAEFNACFRRQRARRPLIIMVRYTSTMSQVAILAKHPNL